MFVVADAFTKSAREKIEGAGGTVQVIEIPTSQLAAIGVDPAADAD
jgi:ribosomal protein L18E